MDSARRVKDRSTLAHRHERSLVIRWIAGVSMLLAVLAASAPGNPGAAAGAIGARSAEPPRAVPGVPSDERPSADDVMARLLAKYKQNDKKYDAVADEIDKEVRKALKSTVWLTEQEAGKARMLDEHPLFVRIEELAQAAQSEAQKPDPKAKARRDALVAKFPWNPRLELDLGLDLGSDRPVPANEKGFIAMGTAPMPVRGFPELATNVYLYGLDAIVSWRAGVKSGAKLVHEGWDAKKPPTMDKTLPGWERIRIYLDGSLPEVPLFAIPWMKHAIHARLMERRAPPSGGQARMDEELALLDSKWNGFTFQVPFAKERFAVVYPMHDLMTDHKSFFYAFPQSSQMEHVGDLPFISIQTYMQYAQTFLGQKIGAGEFIHDGGAPAVANAIASFIADTAYLSRYKTLIDVFVRAVLCPTLRYPESMAYLDYPKGALPHERQADKSFDVTRRLVVIVWAHAGEDPAKLADYLHENLLDQEANRFPSATSLPAAFTVLGHEKEQELVKAIAARIASERGSGANAGGHASPSDFEREFSPFPTYLEMSGEPSSDDLLASFTAFHERLSRAIQDAAYAVIAKELK